MKFERFLLGELRAFAALGRLRFRGLLVLGVHTQHPSAP
jgi:hypothetical protein